jgi:hypothetical protein
MCAASLTSHKREHGAENDHVCHDVNDPRGEQAVGLASQRPNREAVRENRLFLWSSRGSHGINAETITVRLKPDTTY